MISIAKRTRVSPSLTAIIVMVGSMSISGCVANQGDVDDDVEKQVSADEILVSPRNGSEDRFIALSQFSFFSGWAADEVGFVWHNNCRSPGGCPKGYEERIEINNKSEVEQRLAQLYQSNKDYFIRYTTRSGVNGMMAKHAYGRFQRMNRTGVLYSTDDDEDHYVEVADAKQVEMELKRLSFAVPVN